jgi:hypothetical protein
VSTWADATTSQRTAAAFETLLRTYARTAPDGLDIDNPASAQAAISVDYKGSTHGVILNRTAGNPVNGNVLLVTAQDVGTDDDPQDTTVGITGHELAKGTLKVNHVKPTANTLDGDGSASVLSLRANGSGTAAQGIFFDAEDGGTTGKLMNFRQAGLEKFVVDADGDISVGGYNLTDWEVANQSGWCHTFPEFIASNALTIADATKYGTVAHVRKSGEYTHLVVCLNATPTGLTDTKFAVWDESGLLLAVSADRSASLTNGLNEIPLTTSVNLAAGARVYLGVAKLAGTLVMRGISQVSGMVGTRSNRSFATVRANGSWAGGTVTQLNSGGSGIGVWASLELINV